MPSAFLTILVLMADSLQVIESKRGQGKANSQPGFLAETPPASQHFRDNAPEWRSKSPHFHKGFGLAVCNLEAKQHPMQDVLTEPFL